MLGRDAWLEYKGAPCSVWRRGSCGTGGAGSPGVVLAALCTAGKYPSMLWPRSGHPEERRVGKGLTVSS